MERYRILPHTADGEFEAFGTTLAEAFANAGLALASLMWDWEAVCPRSTLPVRVEGCDREQLLVRFLDEIVYLFETRDFLLHAVEQPRITEEPGRLLFTATFSGDARSPQYPVHGQVKAATYNDMRIDQAEGRFRLRAVVDM